MLDKFISLSFLAGDWIRLVTTLGRLDFDQFFKVKVSDSQIII